MDDEVTMPAGAPSGVRSRGERLAWLVTTLVTVASLAGIFLLVLFRPRVSDVPELRVEINTPPTRDQMSFAVSPDGSSVVLVAQQQGRPRLFLRRLSSAEVQAIAGTDGAAYPFWSPDGRSVGFFADNKLKRIDASGGAVQELVAADSARGGAWAADGTIVFALESGPIFRISAAGGAASSPLTELLPGQSSHTFPHFLSDGRHFIYHAQASLDDVRGIYLASLDRPEGVHLMTTAAAAVPAGRDWILFVREGALSAQELDVGGRKLIGEIAVVAHDVAVDVSRNLPALSAARDTVMFRTERAATVSPDGDSRSSIQIILNWVPPPRH